MRLFEAPGLVGESYYQTRRSALRAVLLVLFGLAAALYTGATRLMKMVGMSSLGPELGMSEYLFDVIVSAAMGAFAGALVSWPAGALWESWHRRRRRARG